MHCFASFKTVDMRFQDLYTCYCGFEQCNPLYAFGPAVRPNFLIHVILSGRGYFRNQNGSRELSAGEGFLIEPEQQTFYQADRTDPWSYLWIGFDGKLAPSVVRQLGLGGEHAVFRTSHGDELKEIVFNMCGRKKYSIDQELYIQAQLCMFFSKLIRDIEQAQLIRNDSMDNIYVEAALVYIQNHFQEQISVQRLADHAGVDRSYLYTLFRRNLGMGPREYLTIFRLSRAADLLSYSGHSVEHIATACGYRDPLVFSKAFKTHYGKTPSAYRDN